MIKSTYKLKRMLKKHNIFSVKLNRLVYLNVIFLICNMLIC
jgi:hypothetical protein